ncbi:MAG: hypothetical protein AVDCRST_MAG21-321, partial [uncultured Nocardioidaceae bacterium]
EQASHRHQRVRLADAHQWVWLRKGVLASSGRGNPADPDGGCFHRQAAHSDHGTLLLPPGLGDTVAVQHPHRGVHLPGGARAERVRRRRRCRPRPAVRHAVQRRPDPRRGAVPRNLGQPVHLSRPTLRLAGRVPAVRSRRVTRRGRGRREHKCHRLRGGSLGRRSEPRSDTAAALLVHVGFQHGGRRDRTGAARRQPAVQPAVSRDHAAVGHHVPDRVAARLGRASGPRSTVRLRDAGAGRRGPGSRHAHPGRRPARPVGRLRRRASGAWSRSVPRGRATGPSAGGARAGV